MDRQPRRMRRVNEAVRGVLGSAIGARVKDPRLGFVTITGVEVAADLRHAKVFYSVLGSQKDKAGTLEALRGSQGFLQAEINRELHLKRTPELEFIYDESIDTGMRIHSLIRSEEEALGVDLRAEPDDDSGAEDGPEEQ